MGLILDTSVLIASERRGEAIEDILYQVRKIHGEIDIAISTVSAVELTHGIYRAQTEAAMDRRRVFAERAFQYLSCIRLHSGLLNSPAASRANRLRKETSLHSQTCSSVPRHCISVMRSRPRISSISTASRTSKWFQYDESADTPPQALSVHQCCRCRKTGAAGTRRVGPKPAKAYPGVAYESVEAAGSGRQEPSGGRRRDSRRLLSTLLIQAAARIALDAPGGAGIRPGSAHPPHRSSDRSAGPAWGAAPGLH